MAIVVEGQKDKNILLQVVAIGGVVLLLVIGTYYIFFKNPPFVNVIVPPELETISKFSDVDISPEIITELELYLSLVDHVGKPVINGFGGRDNPFARF